MKAAEIRKSIIQRWISVLLRSPVRLLKGCDIHHSKACSREQLLQAQLFTKEKHKGENNNSLVIQELQRNARESSKWRETVEETRPGPDPLTGSAGRRRRGAEGDRPPSGSASSAIYRS